MPETLFCHIGIKADQLEDLLLQLAIVDTNGAAADLIIIQNKVILLPAHLRRVALEHGDIFDHRGGEKMMGWVPALFVLVPEDEGEVEHPAEAEYVGIT